jgi:hypothetical protein
MRRVQCAKKYPADDYFSVAQSLKLPLGRTLEYYAIFGTKQGSPSTFSPHAREAVGYFDTLLDRHSIQIRQKLPGHTIVQIGTCLLESSSSDGRVPQLQRQQAAIEFDHWVRLQLG